MANNMDMINDEEVDQDKIVNISGYDSFNSYISEGYKVMMEGVKSSNSLPMGRNYHFYQTYTNFRDKMRETVNRLHDMMEEMLWCQGVKMGVRDIMMEDAIDTAIAFNDKMLDRATRHMDLMEGVKTGLMEMTEEVSGSWNRPKKRDKLNFSLSIKKNIPRPQFTFRDKIDNSNTIWVPNIIEKHNSIKPLSILLHRTEDGVEYFTHPYEYELEMWNVPDVQLEKVTPAKVRSLEDTPLIRVDTEHQLDSLVQYLSTQKSFALDLEHHNYRSFMGFTCLMQISSDEKDFIIDALSLRHYLHNLNTVFTNPCILKVLHGADSDVVWLQRDFGLYLVNMFDTHQAAKQLNYPKLSLAFLLSQFCNVDAAKHFQLFDWRTRPLPDEAVKYAREDTHYLLYIARHLSNQLLTKGNGKTNILKAVYEQSKQICTKRFEKLVIDEDSYLSVYRKGRRFFDNRQLFALKALYLWRDKTARELDESLVYVLPDNMLLNISETLPREVQGILACCNPVPPLVKANLLEIHYLIVRAKEQPLVMISEEKTLAQVSTNRTMGMSAEQQLLEQWTHPATAEFRDDLPTVLGSDASPQSNESDEDQQPHLSIFNSKGSWLSLNWVEDNDEETDVIGKELADRLNGMEFVSPYQRYVRVLPYAAQIEKERKEAEVKEAEELRQRSRQQQQMAMEIRSLEESGLIKLKKDDDENIETLKFQVMNERKRKSEEWQRDGNGMPGPKKRGRRNRRDMDGQTAEHLPTTQANSQDNVELRGEDVKMEVKPEFQPSRQNQHHQGQSEEEQDTTRIGDKQIHEAPPPRLNSWKHLKQQKVGGGGGKLKPFDYSQVDYNEKFSSGLESRANAASAPNNKLNVKKGWKNNPGARKFANKKRKRNSVV